MKQIAFSLVALTSSFVLAANVAETNAVLSMAHVKWSKMITSEKARFCGWPTVTAVGPNELVAAYSGDRSAHVCPWGRVQMMRSTDGGETWSEPETVRNGPLDDRDAGILKLANGDWLVFWFTSVAFTQKAILERKPEWRCHYEQLQPDDVRRELGSFVSRSTDGGKTWGPKVRLPVSAPHGGIQLKDGRLMVIGTTDRAVRGLLAGDPEKKGGRKLVDVRGVYAAESKDNGETWEIVGDLPFKDAPAGELCEPYLIEGEDGVLRAYVRNVNLVYSESRDGGKTWTPMRGTKIETWNSPVHLIRLADGRTLMTCARRVGWSVKKEKANGRKTCVFALLGDKNGSLESFEAGQEIPLYFDDWADMGYASSAQVADGSIVTILYCHHNRRGPACVYGVKWTLP